MRGSAPLSLLASALPAARAISLERCAYRMTDMEHTDGSYRLAIFDCDFDDDLYLKSRIDGGLAPIPSDSSREEVEAALSSSSVVSQVPWANFAGLTVMEGAVPNSLFALSHNVELRCEHGGISFELFQKPSHEPPVNFLYSLPPTKNSINTLWQAFGAYNWPEHPLPRRMSVGLMVDAGAISTDDIETCIDEGKLIMSADTRPLEACPECQFVPLRRGCSEAECSIYHYSDGAGNAIDPLSSVLVEYANNECNLERFDDFNDERLPKLFDLLEKAKTEKESEAALLSYTTIVNDVEYAACADAFKSFYTTRSASIFMKGVRGCEDPGDESDPCCNEAMQWSDCCLPEDRYIDIDGVFNATNLEEINSACGANGAGVAALLDSEISQVLISASHPEFGCDAAYERANPKGDSGIYKTLWDDSPVSKCEEEVRWGKSITGQDMCNTGEECWSSSCVSYGGPTKKCTNLLGEAVAGPLLTCIAQRLDPKLWKYVAQKLGIDPSKIKRGAELKGAQWDHAVETFKNLVGSPNCVGEEADQGICAIVDMTKEECESVNHVHDWQRKMEWVVDESLIHGGMCKKRNSYWWENDVGIHIHGHTNDVQEECQAIFDAMQGACIDSTTPKGRYWFKPQEECTGETESWVSFASHTVVGHRLVSRRTWMLDEASGNWAEAFREGNEHACTLQTSCNWDPDNYVTSGDKDLCLDPTPLESTTYPRASFEQDGKPMACLQCWGSRCEDFWSASPPICAVSPHDHDDCAQKSGGGPNNDPPVSAMTIEGHDSHVKCRRNNLKTEAECLPSDFCPLPHEETNPWDEWVHHCAESSCWDLTKTEQQQCQYDEESKISFGWRSEYRNGVGACKLEYDHERDTHFEKSNCEEAGFTWWEGRAFKPGAFHTADECTQFCNDGSWPIKRTCTSGSCNEHCAQCVVGDSWRFPAGAACYLADEIDQDACFSLENYDWDWGKNLCYRKNFSGNEADCSDLDGSGSEDYDDLFFMSMSMSMSMSMMTSEPGFDWVISGEQSAPALTALSHRYVSCPAQSEDTCSAYCWARDHEDWASCQNEGLEWDWSLSRCKHPTWRVNKSSSPTCESYTADLDESTPDHKFWESAEKCWSDGCRFEHGSPPTCTGQGSGCAEQDGDTEWVDGGDEDTTAAKLLLGCHWDQRPCPTEESCLEAGECEDWFLHEGRCVVPIEPNEWGHRKSCHEMTHPEDGTTYDWAEKLGCVARVSDRHVKESECDSVVGGTWHVRAKSKEQCEGDRGDICTHPFDEWRIFGGIESEEKCAMCGYKRTHPTTWRNGVWSDSAETPLYWVERAFSPKNKWEENSFDSEAFHSLIRNTISRYVADAFKRKVYCELNAYNAFIPHVISMCHADGDNGQNVVKYDLTSSQVSCGDLQDQPPMETYEGSISYANAECTNSSDTFAEATMGKVVPLAGSSRRRTTSSSECSQHEIVTNSYNELVGQKLGSGLSFTGVDNATVCIKPTVPDSEICSKYVEFGVSTVDDSGSYSVPLSVITSENAQGELCFDGSESGVTYAPVKLVSGWRTAGFNTTQAPTSFSDTQSPSTSPTEDSSTGSPTMSNTSALSAAPSEAPSASPTKAGTTESPTISTRPSSSPSAEPFYEPTISVEPSTKPSLNSKFSAQPSAVASVQPSLNPTVSGHPTASAQPSMSLNASAEPSLNPTVSVHPTASVHPSMSLNASVEPSLNPTVTGDPTASAQPSISLNASAEPSLNPTVSGHPTASTQPPMSLKPSLLQSSTPSMLSPSMEPSVPPTMPPTKADTGSVEVTFDVSVKLNGFPSVSDLSVDSLDAITRLLEKVFSSLLPPGAIIRLLEVGGFAVARRLVRFLEEVDSSGVDVEFEVTMTQQCGTAACDNSEAISSNLYDQVTTNLKAKVDDGNMARVIQEEAESEGVAELTNITISSFHASEATVKVEKAQVEGELTDAPTVAPTADSASSMIGNKLLMPIVVALLLLGAFFGIH